VGNGHASRGRFYFRLVNTERFLRHKIAVHLKGSGSASSAHPDILTMAAAALVRRKIPQAFEDQGGLPNFP